jgi:hypothetical protein
MVNKSIGRRIRGVSKSSTNDVGTSRINDDSVVGESGTESDVDREPSSDDRDVDEQSNSTNSVNVVSIEPGTLSEFIAERAAERAADSGSGDDNGRTRRRRSDSGVKRGRKSRKETNAPLVPLINMVHTWASVILKAPELILEESEQEQLSKAYDEFAQYHDVPILSEKRISEINLGVAVLMIYGTRIVAIRNRKKEEKASNVTRMPNSSSVRHNIV